MRSHEEQPAKNHSTNFFFSRRYREFFNVKLFENASLAVSPDDVCRQHPCVIPIKKSTKTFRSESSKTLRNKTSKIANAVNHNRPYKHRMQKNSGICLTALIWHSLLTFHKYQTTPVFYNTLHQKACALLRDSSKIPSKKLIRTMTETAEPKSDEQKTESPNKCFAYDVYSLLHNGNISRHHPTSAAINRRTTANDSPTLCRKKFEEIRSALTKYTVLAVLRFLTAWLDFHRIFLPVRVNIYLVSLFRLKTKSSI